LSAKNGIVSFDQRARQWVIEAAPHIAMRVKRVFAKADKHRTGKIRLSDSAEVAADLQWFLQRYPMEVLDKPYLERAASAYHERRSFIESMLDNQVEPQPFDVAIEPRKYQSIAAAILLAQGRLLLADDLGLGKTASAILTLTDPRTRPAVVVTLTHLQRQWAHEIARFAPQLRVHICKTFAAYDITAGLNSNGQIPLIAAFPDVIILNYHKLAGWAETLAKVAKSVIYDECQELRLEGSAKYDAARVLSRAAKFRMGLSATPFYNYGGEFFTVNECIAPGALGSKDEFIREWCVSAYGDKPKIKNPQAFGAFVREAGIMLRRTRAEVQRELPEVQKIVHYVDSDAKAFAKIEGNAARLAELILATVEQEKGQRMRASGELDMMLRQATGVAKAPYVAEFVRMLVESGEKVVLFGWHRAVYDIWMEALKDLRPALYTGSESPAAKDEAKRRFVSGDTSLLIISLRSGAGLDGLQQVARVGVFGELDWSPGVHEQCLGRIHRDGQKNSVMAYYLVAEDGSDPIIMEALGLKRAQIEGVRNLATGDDLFERLDTSPDSIRKLAETYLQRKQAPAKKSA
jgi:SNF2 family DNA or RNA helicase